MDADRGPERVPLPATDPSAGHADDEADAGPVPPFPPLPDGGLAAAMPAWLREAPAGGSAPSGSAPADPVPADTIPLLTEEDLPAWLRAIGARGGPEPAPDLPRPAVAPGDEVPVETLQTTLRGSRPPGAVSEGAAAAPALGQANQGMDYRQIAADSPPIDADSPPPDPIPRATPYRSEPPRRAAPPSAARASWVAALLIVLLLAVLVGIAWLAGGIPLPAP